MKYSQAQDINRRLQAIGGGSADIQPCACSGVEGEYCIVIDAASGETVRERDYKRARIAISAVGALVKLLGEMQG